MNKFIKEKIDWRAVQIEINSRLKANHSAHYIRAVYRGNLVSSKIKAILAEILPPYQKPERFSLYPLKPEKAIGIFFRREAPPYRKKK